MLSNSLAKILSKLSKLGMGKTLMIHPRAKLLSICESMECKKQVLCSQTIVVIQTQDNNCRSFGSKRIKMSERRFWGDE